MRAISIFKTSLKPAEQFDKYKKSKADVSPWCFSISGWIGWMDGPYGANDNFNRIFDKRQKPREISRVRVREVE